MPIPINTNQDGLVAFISDQMTNTNFSSTAAFIWSVADLLRGNFKQSQYGRVILPFTLLRRLECVLEESKEAVVIQAEKIKAMNLPEEAQEKLLFRATQTSDNAKGLTFFNTSPMSLGKMEQNDIKADLECYIKSFSTDAREIFEHFKFDEFVGMLDDADLLYKVVKRFATTDLSTKDISNHEMGFVFEELIRRFAESSNETAGEHFTPRDIVRLTTSLVFMEDDEALTKDGIIRTIYDPTAGTGGFLSSGMEYVHELNPKAVMRAFGQELNPESYAICKADMLIKGQDVSSIKLGNTLSNDQLPADKFDYMLSNPPFGVDWKKIEGEIKDEHTLKGFDGRFGAGLPRVSDATLLFLLNIISKFRDKANGGSRAGIIVNGSCLFNGDAGSGESEIRRYIIESDLLEAIVSLPKNMFFNTSVQPYILIISNNKSSFRKDRVQLIDGSKLGLGLKNQVGMKSVFLDEMSINHILESYSLFENKEGCKIVDSTNFTYRQVKVGISQRQFEYEIVPNGVDAIEYLKEHLHDIHEHHNIDLKYTDDKDGKLGRLGVDFSFDIFNPESEKSGRQFRYYFKAMKSDEVWSIAIAKNWQKVIFRDQFEAKEVDSNKYHLFSLNQDFDADYLKYFFNSEKWKQWIFTYRSNGVLNVMNKYRAVRKKINFPSFTDQREIAFILDESSKLKQKITILETDLWREGKSDYSLEKYRLPVDKDLHSRVIELSPYPFANIMHHYESISEHEYKARYELLLKLFECLAVFSVSLAIGFIEEECGADEALKLLRSEKRFIKNSSFGNWIGVTKKIIEVRDKSPDLFERNLVMSIFLNERVINLFDEAVIIRNDTSGHGSYPTKLAARDTFRKVENIYLGFLNIFHDLFDKYRLVRPIHGVWNEKLYSYQMEEYSGLGCYPFGLETIVSKKPFADGELYFISKENSEEKIKIFPFLSLIDLEEDSGLEAFYFFSKKSDVDGSKDEFLFISHQQIHKQKQLHKNHRLKAIF